MTYFRFKSTPFAAVLLAAFLLIGGMGLSQHASAQQSLTYAMMVPPVTLDPPNIEDSGSSHVAIHVTEPLVMVGADGTLQPWLAESWEANEDATVWTVHLREGINFTDGTPFNADAVKFTYERAVNPDKPTKRRARLGVIRDVQVVDEYTVDFVLEQPYSALPFVLTDSAMYIVSPAAATALGDDFANEAVGTGPYIVKEFVSNQHAVLEKNPDYWQPTGNVQSVRVIHVPEYSTRQFMLERGEAHIVQDVSPESMDSLGRMPGVTTVGRSSFRQSMVSMNVQATPLNNKLVRQALNYAIDKEAIVVHLARNTAIANDSPVPPSVDGYTPVGAYDYDPVKAAALLAEAGYPNGFTVDLWGFTAGGDFMNTEIVELIQAYLAEIGVNVRVSEADVSAQIERVSQGPEGSRTSGKQLMWLGGPASRGIQDFFESFFTTSRWAPNGSNRGFYSNERVDELVERAGRTSDTDARNAIYAELQEIIMDDAPWIFLHTISLLWGHADNLEGLQFLPNDLVLLHGANFR